MSVTLGESSRSPDRLYSLQELPVAVQSSSPSVAARDMTNSQLNGGHDTREGRGSGIMQQPVGLCHDKPGCEAVCSHGDNAVNVNCHGKRNETRDKECVEVAEPRQQARGGASRLRQQWARQTKPKLCGTEWTEEGRFVHGENVREDGGEVGVRGDGGGGGGRGENQQPQAQPDTSNGKPPSHQHPNSSPEAANTSPLSLCACGRPSRQLMKSQSVGSISNESLTISSLWEAPSYDTVPDFLSSLGFDDFDSPELIPDRFIPPELHFVRPSLMRQATLGSVGPDNDSPPLDGLLLGATADTVAGEVTVSVDQPDTDTDTDPPFPPQTLALYLPSKSPLPWQPASLETVVEETGSELLSPRPSSRLSSRLTPHLNSPILSIDRTITPDIPSGLEGDVSTGLLGAGLAQRLRQQVLAKEDLRQRQMSLGGDSDTSSLYFSVGSHFDEGEESGSGIKEGGTREATEEGETGGKRRRRGNYAPPPQLLMWLEKSETASDTADQPWPFSECSSTGNSPAHCMLSDNPLPSITLNGNSNNNCQQPMVCKQSGSVPVRQMAAPDSEVKERPLENGVCTKLKTSSFMSSVHHHTPPSPP